MPSISLDKSVLVAFNFAALLRAVTQFFGSSLEENSGKTADRIDVLLVSGRKCRVIDDDDARVFCPPIHRTNEETRTYTCVCVYIYIYIIFFLFSQVHRT